MRISLGERKGKRRGRRRRSGSKTFESAIAQPQIQSRRRSEPPNPTTKRSGAESRSRSETLQAPVRSIAWRRVRRRAVGLRLLVALIMMSLVGTIIYTSAAEQFFVYDAQVSGNYYIDRDTIYQAAGVHTNNIFWIQSQKVGERIKRLDGIKAVRVRCGLPAQVLIEVQERKPVVMWRVETQGRDWWLDEDGVVLPYHGVISDATFVVDSTERHLNVGDHIEPDGIVRSVQLLAASLPEVRVFFYQANRGLSFTQSTAHGEWPVYMGDAKELPRKIRALQALTDHLMKNQIYPSYVDLRWPRHPVYGKSGGKAASGGQ